jgi:DNA polymerase-3 subunit beta
MKFIVSRDVLYKNLSAISGVLCTNSTLPILDNFLFTIEGDNLTLTASDLDSTMSAEIELSNVEGEGAVAVPSKILLETLKLIPETPIVFAIDEESKVVKFTAANGEYDSPCLQGMNIRRLRGWNRATLLK